MARFDLTDFEWSIIQREYENWSRDRPVVDTAHRTLETCVAEAIRLLAEIRSAFQPKLNFRLRQDS
jgi:hypothetical protein